MSYWLMGKAIHIDEPVVTPDAARQINALMATEWYVPEDAGEFAWRVGLPRRNLALGAVLWRLFRMKMAIAVWSANWIMPAGNSLAGIAVLEQLTKQLGRSVY
ncbi:glutaminase [Shigella flexneri]